MEHFISLIRFTIVHSICWHSRMLHFALRSMAYATSTESKQLIIAVFAVDIAINSTMRIMLYTFVDVYKELICLAVYARVFRSSSDIS